MITFFILLSIFFFPIVSAQGEWHLLHASVGVSAMHMQLLHNNKVVIFDRTDFGPSNLSLPPHLCRHDPRDLALQTDCTAHSILYSLPTNTFRPLNLQTDTWCSSGSLLPNGTLAQTGGFNDGDHVLRMFSPCYDDDDDGNCDWVEFPGYLSERRWYASNQILPDGRIIIVGGRRQFNYEFYPRSSNLYSLDFLRETSDVDENNLYPFLHLLPDGNLFIFANTRSISLDYKRNRVVREFPPIPGGEPRNYPSSGSSVLLPIIETPSVQAEVLVCGGAPPGGVSAAGRGNFLSASRTCGRLKVSDENPNWVMEEMPIPRVMGDMLILPTGDVIIINGASSGAAGWEAGRGPVTTPVIYRHSGDVNDTDRFSVMSGSEIPRMYHSSAVLLPDGRILVGGSNPHVYYNFTNVIYPTELSLESYSPPYLSPSFSSIRPQILFLNKNIRYGRPFLVVFNLCEYRINDGVLSANIIAPSFSTHAVAMNQRMVVLRAESVMKVAENRYRLSVVAPSTPEIAPPGYYMLFLVHSDIPSYGMWVKIH